MGIVRVCDLCGQPLRTVGRRFKIKEQKFSFHESWWMKIECHDECVKLLMEAIMKEEPNENQT